VRPTSFRNHPDWISLHRNLFTSSIVDIIQTEIFDMTLKSQPNVKMKKWMWSTD
jgi:hypothetical protein